MRPAVGYSRGGPLSSRTQLSGHSLERTSDSDNLELDDLASLSLDGDFINFKGLVGLDCKTGVAIALSVVERLQRTHSKSPWSVHLIFTIGEEAGQKGAIRGPISRLLAGNVRFGIVIDRMTKGRGAPRNEKGDCVRHAIGMYKGVPLLDPDSREDMMAHLNAAMTKLQAPGAAKSEPLPLIESPNNADALEWRGRWDAEILGPTLLLSEQDSTPELERALQNYSKATRAVMERMAAISPEERVSSMYAEPRIGRYQAMKQVYEAVHSRPVVQPNLWFSCVNLSYDYDDHDGSVSLAELNLTALIVVGFVKSAASSTS